jgi:hypothetical protein
MSRILTIYSPRLLPTSLVDMADIRWHRISAALAARGHTVHLASAELHRRFVGNLVSPSGLTTIPITRVRWEDYDVVKTLFHLGFETFEYYGGTGHPFVISKLGSVVGPTDMEGIYFYGRSRDLMFDTQRRIAATSRFVTLLSEPAVKLWCDSFGKESPTLLVPGAAEALIPLPGSDPYPPDCRVRCVFSGNFYHTHPASQPEAHRTLTSRLNKLAMLLNQRGARLFVVGPGDHRSLDRRVLTYCGSVSYQESWDFLHFATVGIIVAAGPFMHNNESTKIYHYLRAGLPVVSEAGFPNDDVIRDAGLGFVVENGKLDHMADCVIEAAEKDWDRRGAVQFILDHHTWDHRAAIYDRLLRMSQKS